MKTQRGDTIIEVMLAFAILSLTIVGLVLLMNKGMATAQRSLEITLVRQQIDAQLTMLNNLKQTDPTAWQNLLKSNVAATQPPDLNTYTTCPDSAALSAEHAFFLASNNAQTAVVPEVNLSPTNLQPAPTYARVDTFALAPVSYGIWTTLVKSEGFNTSPAYDVHVRACWYSIGDKQPTVIATVMRMYDAN